jgi:S-DNA-T family DNA segregation ATPase FtsK/SpoIIIE
LDPDTTSGLQVNREELEEKARFLEEKLREFDVLGEVVGIQPGPVITRFEIKPEAGVKISRFVSCQDDLALVMKASRVRVVAPIPGKDAVGIEIPNEKALIVRLRSVLETKAFQHSPSKLTIALGHTIDGQPFAADLGQMPHLLVAGATGSGKSVCLNAIITSILYRALPTEVKFVLIDPKKLELSLYRKLKGHHLATREGMTEDVITTPDGAVSVLRSLEMEMEQRYRMLARAGVRKIEDYNTALKEGRISGEAGFKPLPYVVLVVDELADLMLTAAREIEEPIARLAQMSRAVGIHLVLATQRPSVDVITGVIKANFPCRIAFQVAQKTDSRTILDRNGAEKLLGQGDMLFLHPRQSEPIRLHGAFVSTEEVQRVMDFIGEQPESETWLLPGAGSDSSGEFSADADRDELFREAARLVIRHNQGSASLLQRRLRVGYARAGRLIDELEAAGILGPFDGSKARDVLVEEDYLERLDEMESLEGEETP